MAITSDWPLPPDGIRFLTPRQLLTQLENHPLTRPLYPIALGYYPVAHRHHMQRAEHDNYLLMYCTAGRGLVQCKGAEYPVAVGDLVVLPKQAAHHYRADAQKPWTLFWLHFDGELAQTFYENLQLPAPCQNIGLQPRVIAGFDNLAELRNSGYQLPAFVYGCHQLQALLSYLALLIRQQRPRNSASIDLQRIESIMQEHVHRQLNLDALAAQARLSKYHFSKVFKQLTGQSPIQYFIHLKMQQGCFLLDSGNRSIKQISAELGYEDAYYFSRLFKKVIGLSPEQYRKSKYR